MVRVGERQEAILEEAAAISTALLQTQAIADPRAAEIGRRLDEYQRLRRDFVAAPPDPAVLDDFNRRTVAMQAEIWAPLTVIARERPDPVVATLMSSLTAAFDTGNAVRFALDFPLVPALRQLVATVALLTMAALGVLLGVRGKRMAGLVALLIVMSGSVLLYIFDAAAARIGQQRPPTDVYEWNIEAISAGTPGTPR
jgi:hypothetical protein